MKKLKHMEFKHKNEEYIVIEVLPDTKEVSIGTHCIGIKPVPEGYEGVVDTNGWYHAYTNSFHGYGEEVTDKPFLIEDMIDNHCFLDCNPHCNPDNYPELTEHHSLDLYMSALSDYGHAEHYTYEYFKVFKRTEQYLFNL